MSSGAIKLGILLSGGGRTMLNLAEKIQAGRLEAEIACVISSRSEVAGVPLARGLGVEPVILRRREFADVGAFSGRIIEVMEAAGVDLICQCGWLCFWEIPPSWADKVVNIHPSLLPKFGGKGMWGHHVHEAVLAAGEAISGCTVHFVTNQYDAGPIILQRTCPVQAGDTADTLAARVFEQECIAYPEAIRLYREKRLKVVEGKVVVKS